MVETGGDLHNRAFVAGLLLVGSAAVVWGLYLLLTGDTIDAPAIFAIAIGGSILVVTAFFIIPELSSAPAPVPLPLVAASPSSNRLPIETMREYLTLLSQAEEKWLKHLDAVTSAQSAPAPGPAPRVVPVAVAAPPRETLAAKSVDERVESELLAFDTAIQTGMKRRANEDALSYVGRVQADRPAGSRSLPPVTASVAAESMVEDLLEAHRTLPSRSLSQLGETIQERVNQVGASVGVGRSPGEPMMDYANRLRSKLTAPAPPPAAKPTLDFILRPPARPAAGVAAAPKPAPPVSPPPGQNPGLTWALALYRGFLQNYFNPTEIDQLSKDVVASSSGTPRGARSEEELLMYSRLVKNAIRASQRTSRAPSEVDKVLREFDQFVELLHAAQAPPTPPARSPPRSSTPA